MSNHGARIAWLAPSLIEGSGGHRTIFQNVQALIERGHRCEIYLEPTPGESLAGATRKLASYFGPTAASIHLGFDVARGCDLVFATAWYTAKFVDEISHCRRKAYFVQDFEAYFNPIGDAYLSAVDSYRFGLVPITIGRWLAHKLAAEFDTPARYFDFCADQSVYRHDPRVERENAVCFICQPEKPRRCARLGLEALSILKHWMPGVKVYLYGSRAHTGAWFEHTNLELLDVQACNRLYNRCAVGFCLSSTNPSRIPFEMMAAGLPVVDLHRENNLYDMPDAAVLLADSRPERLAEALLQLLQDAPRRAAMSQAALEFMRDRDLSLGYRQFADAVEAVLRDEPVAAPLPEPVYLRPCDAAPLDTIGLSAEARASGVRAAAAGARAARVTEEARAREELDSIERSRAWRLLTWVKSSWAYRRLAALRWGPEHVPLESVSDVCERLARVKASRAYRTIHRLKETATYRWLARRRHGSTAG